MFEFNFKLIASLGAGLCVAGMGYYLITAWRKTPVEDRQYMDTLPRLLRLFWPLVNTLAYFIGEIVGPDYLQAQKSRILAAYLSHLLSEEQLIALQIITALLFALIAYLFDFTIGLCLFFLTCGYFFPILQLNELKKKREIELHRELPCYLDFIGMSIKAGCGFDMAFKYAVDKGPKGSLQREFNRVLSDKNAGVSTREAFSDIKHRANFSEMMDFISIVLQSQQTGAELGDRLSALADQCRLNRFNRAEKAAAKAPAKLLMPLVLFIFPTTFIVIAFPIIMKIMNEL